MARPFLPCYFCGAPRQQRQYLHERDGRAVPTCPECHGIRVGMGQIKSRLSNPHACGRWQDVCLGRTLLAGGNVRAAALLGVVA